MSSSPYVSHYGVGLLDDLHNYFPDLLYNPDSFLSVRDVLQYIRQKTRERFDLFSLGQQSYVRSSPGAVAPTPPVAPSNFTPPTRSSAAPIYQYSVHEEGEEDFSAQLFLSLLNLPAGPLTRRTTPLRGGGLDAFLQSVPIRPTPEQISQNTTVGRLASDEEQTCAICQDRLLAEQEGRKLNACAHWFHRSCIDTWFQDHVHCPVCRHDVRDPVAPATGRRSRTTSSHT